MHWRNDILAFALGLAAFGCSMRPAATAPPQPLPVDPKIMCQPRTTGPRPSTTSSKSPSPKAARIQARVRSRYNDLRSCYEEALWRDRNARGKLVVRMAITPDGSVTSVCAEEVTLEDGEAISCMIDVFRGLSFHDLVGGFTRVVYPIIYEPY